VADRRLTGVLLVGGASVRFGSPKALARLGEETLAERGWRILAEACDERIAVGKGPELDLPFEIVDDDIPVRAPIAGVIAGLRAAATDVAVFLPVDCPFVPPFLLRTLGERCLDAAVTQVGPLPGAWARSALPALERRLAQGAYSLLDAYAELAVARIEVDPQDVADADTPTELAELVEGLPRS